MKPRSDPIIDCRGLWRIFGGDEATARRMVADGASREQIHDATGSVVAVRDVSFDVSRGESFIVMGLSGSGKSTLIRCLCRLIEPIAGQVTIDGAVMADLDAEELRDLRRKRISMVFQHFGLFPHFTVLRNAAYGLEIRGVGKEERYARAFEVLEMVGLAQWSDRYPQELSGGMQQRVGLARALVVDPEILFFDEPFSALDPLIRRDMQDELIELQQRMHRTVVFITHDFHEALKLGDRIAIMKDGEFDQVGSPTDIMTEPATDYVREFTQDVPAAKVLTAGFAAVWSDDIRAGLERIPASATLDSILPRLLESPDPLHVVDEEGETVGLVDRAMVASVLDGRSVP